MVQGRPSSFPYFTLNHFFTLSIHFPYNFLVSSSSRLVSLFMLLNFLPSLFFSIVFVFLSLFYSRLIFILYSFQLTFTCSLHFPFCFSLPHVFLLFSSLCYISSPSFVRSLLLSFIFFFPSSPFMQAFSHSSFALSSSYAHFSLLLHSPPSPFPLLLHSPPSPLPLLPRPIITPTHAAVNLCRKQGST